MPARQKEANAMHTSPLYLKMEKTFFFMFQDYLPISPHNPGFFFAFKLSVGHQPIDFFLKINIDQKGKCMNWFKKCPKRWQSTPFPPSFPCLAIPERVTGAGHL